MPNTNCIYLCSCMDSAYSKKMLYAAHHAVSGRTGALQKYDRGAEFVDSSSIICEHLADILLFFFSLRKCLKGI